MQLEEILKEIGFTEYKSKVYKTLLFLGIASSATVAKESVFLKQKLMEF
jgi:sugar-specific transcriptional regulator TrmB